MSSARTRRATASSSLAIGTAAVFIFSVAVLSFVVDERGTGVRGFGSDWTLRGHVDDLTIPAPKGHRA